MTLVKTGAIVAVVIAVGFSGGKAGASGIPVFDGAAQTQSIIELQNQLRQIGHEIQMIEGQARAYATQIQEYAQLINQTAALTRARNLGQLANGIRQHSGRRYLPDGIDQFVDLGASTAGTVGDVAQRYKQLQNAYQPLTAQQFDPANPTGGLAQAMQRLTGTTYGTLSATEAVYGSISGRMEDVEAMLEHLNSSPDLKETSDLGVRVAAEQALTETERLRLQALALQLAATEQNAKLMRLKQANAMNVYDPTVASSAVR